MASENLVNELFEIVQENTKDILSFNDFEKDLLKGINLQNDEIDRALSLMVSQAKKNPNIIGESKGGIFTVSPSFSDAVVSTIKYENQFIEGKQEFINRKNSNISIEVSNIIISSAILDSLINNYEDLNYGEKQTLLNSFDSMSKSQKSSFLDKTIRELEKQKDKAKTPDEKKTASQVIDVAKTSKENMDNTPEDMSDEEKISAIAILEKLYPDSVKEIRTLPNFNSMSLDEIYDQITSDLAKKSAKLSLEASELLKKDKFQEMLKSNKIMKELYNLTESSLIIKFIRTGKFKDYGHTVESLLSLDPKEIRRLAFVAEIEWRGDNSLADNYGSDWRDHFYDQNIVYNNAQHVIPKDKVRPSSPQLKSGQSFEESLKVFAGEGSLSMDLAARMKKLSFSYGFSTNSELGNEDSDLQTQKDSQMNLEGGLSKFIQPAKDSLNVDDVLEIVEQIPLALKKAGFSVDDIKRALQEYARIVSTVEVSRRDMQKDVNAKINDLIEKSQSNQTQKDILEILNTIQFNGQKAKILKNFREDFVDKLENIAENPLEYERKASGEPLDFGIEKALTIFFEKNAVDLNATAIENITPAAKESSFIGLKVEDESFIKPSGPKKSTKNLFGGEKDFYTGEIGIIDSVRTSQIEDITLEIKELGKMMDKFKEDKTEKESNKELEQDDESRSDDDEPIQ